MYYFDVYFNDELLEIRVDESEVSVTKLKNNILRSFPNLNFTKLNLYLQEGTKLFPLDNNEIVDDEQDFILKIKND